MVDLLNEDGRYHATIRPYTANTDRKVGRLRVPGAGREGHRIEVWRKKDERYPGNRLICHDTCETYRTNRELAGKVLKLLRDGPPDRRKKGSMWNL